MAVTSTAQKRRHFQLHIPVLQLEVGDKAPHLHGDSALSLILLFKVTLGGKKIKRVCMGVEVRQREKEDQACHTVTLCRRVIKAITYSLRYKEENRSPALTNSRL